MPRFSGFTDRGMLIRVRLTLLCLWPLVPSLGSSAKSSEISKKSTRDDDDDDDDDDNAPDNSEYAIEEGNQGPSYTPLTIALQGTLQLSHVHLWADINMIMHRVGADDIPDLPGANSKKSKTP